MHWNSSSIIFRALYFKIGWSFGSFFIIWYSSLKSILFLKNILGTFPTFSVSSGYHFITYLLPSCECLQKMRVQSLKKLWEKHRSWDKRVVEVDCTLLVLQYPTARGWPSCHPLWLWQHSYRKQWEHIRWETCLGYSEMEYFYLIRRQVLPTEPSATTTSFTAMVFWNLFIMCNKNTPKEAIDFLLLDDSLFTMIMSIVK